MERRGGRRGAGRRAGLRALAGAAPGSAGRSGAGGAGDEGAPAPTPRIDSRSRSREDKGLLPPGGSGPGLSPVSPQRGRVRRSLPRPLLYAPERRRGLRGRAEGAVKGWPRRPPGAQGEGHPDQAGGGARSPRPLQPAEGPAARWAQAPRAPRTRPREGLGARPWPCWGWARRPDGATTLVWVAGPWGPIAQRTVCAHPRRFRWRTGSG